MHEDANGSRGERLCATTTVYYGARSKGLGRHSVTRVAGGPDGCERCTLNEPLEETTCCALFCCAVRFVRLYCEVGSARAFT